MNCLYQTKRISKLKEKMLSSKRYASIEQARIITRVYQENEKLSIPKKRALSLKAALEELEISVEDEELIVGNRTKGVRYGVVFPESGCSWINQEFETLPTRPQDQFLVKEEDIKEFREKIYPYWKGKSLEDAIKGTYGVEINEISKVVKINQKDHAQGHICPDSALWLKLGPQGLMEKVKEKLKNCKDEQKEFYECTILVLEGAVHFMQRYHDLIEREKIESLKEVGKICMNLSKRPPETFHEAVQSLWFLFVILHMESNASSFSPGRMDQYLYPYYQRDIEKGRLTKQEALEILECLWLKFNQVVYLRNQNSAKYFAGFPIGFNIAIGGVDEKGNDTYNDLSLLCLKAQEHLGLPQPNLSVRLNKNSSHELMQAAIKVVSLGSGMPQFFNDEAIIQPMIEDLGIEEKDARNYAIVGCVELTTHGNNLGWSDAAMFNFNKVLEYHIEKKADITVVVKEMPVGEDVTRFGVVKLNEDYRIQEFEEKPLVATSNLVSTGVYVIRRRQLIELIEKCAMENRHDFVQDILIRYKNNKRIYGYKMQDYWSNISTVESYYKTNMDFLKPEVRKYFFKDLPSVYSKVSDQPPAKYNPGSKVRNSLISSGCIINGEVDGSVVFHQAYIGNNCVIKNSIILNDVYIGDNTVIENCIVESHSTINPNEKLGSEDSEVQIINERNFRYSL